MAITLPGFLRSCFGVRPQAPANVGPEQRRRSVSIAVPAGPRAPARDAGPGVFTRIKSWVVRTFRNVACCGFRRNPQQDNSSTHGGTPRTPAADSSYMASVEESASERASNAHATGENASPRTSFGSDSAAGGLSRTESEPASGVPMSGGGASYPISYDDSDIGPDDTEYESDAFSSDSGYDVDSAFDEREFVVGADSDSDGPGVNRAPVNLAGRDLRTADLRGVNLEGAVLEGANLAGVDLTGANLKGANLKGANLEGAILHKTDLSHAQLQGANLRNACLRYVSLENSELRGVDLRAARYVWQTDFTSANLRGARFDGMSLLQNRCGLSKARLDGQGVQAFRSEIDAISPTGLCNPRKLQRLLDDGTNGASILTSIDSAPVPPADKLMMMESLVTKLGEAYRNSTGASDAVKFVRHFLDKNSWYERESIAISMFPEAVPAAEGTDLDRSESTEDVSRRSEGQRPMAHPRVTSLARSGSGSGLATRAGRSGSLSELTPRLSRSGSVSELTPRAGRSGSVSELTPRVGHSGAVSELTPRGGRSASVSAGTRPVRSGSPSAIPQHLVRSGSMSGLTRSDSMTNLGSVDGVANPGSVGSAVTEASEFAQLASSKGLEIIESASTKTGSDVPRLSGTLDVGDPDAIKLLQLALKQGMDLNHLHLSGPIGDHIVARQLLEVLDDTPPQSLPRNIDVAVVDAGVGLGDDVRAGKTDELWERTLTTMHLAEYGVRIMSAG